MDNSAYVPNHLPPPSLVVFSQAGGLPEALRMQRPFNPQVSVPLSFTLCLSVRITLYLRCISLIRNELECDLILCLSNVDFDIFCTVKFLLFKKVRSCKCKSDYSKHIIFVNDDLIFLYVTCTQTSCKLKN